MEGRRILGGLISYWQPSLNEFVEKYNIKFITSICSILSFSGVITYFILSFFNKSTDNISLENLSLKHMIGKISNKLIDLENTLKQKNYVIEMKQEENLKLIQNLTQRLQHIETCLTDSE